MKTTKPAAVSGRRFEEEELGQQGIFLRLRIAHLVFRRSQSGIPPIFNGEQSEINLVSRPIGSGLLASAMDTFGRILPLDAAFPSVAGWRSAGSRKK